MQEDARYCVYIHRRKDTNEIFYVGHGTKRRVKAACKYTRSKAWHTVVATAGGFIYEIIKDNLSKIDAISYETSLLSFYDNLVNCGKNNSPRPYPNKEYFQKYVDYSEYSDSGLIWTENSKNRNKGQQAGYCKRVNNKNYWTITIEKIPYRVHRIIAILSDMSLNEYLVVDHIDGNSMNNKVSNLRVCTQAENMRHVNTSKSSSQGVKFNEKDQRWIAQWQENFKQREKGFSVKKYGFDVAKELALDYRRKMVELLK